MNLTREQIDFFHSCARDVVETDQYQQMAEFMQHGNTTCLQHCIAVAYYSYCFYIKLGGRKHRNSIIRGALLHDFFLYDWHERGRRAGWKLHGFTHPRAAWLNAKKYFMMNQTEKDIILKHMWPLTIIPPRRKEALIVCLADKLCAILETFKLLTDTELSGYCVLLPADQ